MLKHTEMTRTHARRWLALAKHLYSIREPRAGENGVGFDMRELFRQTNDRAWRRRHPCGTAACAAGHMSQIPMFQKLGVGLTPSSDTGRRYIQLHGCEESISTIAKEIFGLDSQTESEDVIEKIFYDRTNNPKNKARQIIALARASYPKLVVGLPDSWLSQPKSKPKSKSVPRKRK